MKTAVIYYSLSENTKEAAETIASALDADCIRIGTVKPMPTGRTQQIMYGGMLATFGLKPQITGVPENLDSYDRIILGTPVWAGKMAPAILTLLSNPAVPEKVTAVFALSGSGNAESCLARMKKKLPNLTVTASLADHYNELSAKNAEKTTAFFEQLKN